MIRAAIFFLLASLALGQLITPTRANLVYPTMPHSTTSAYTAINSVASGAGLDQAALCFPAEVSGTLTAVRLESSSVTTAQAVAVELHLADTATASGPPGGLAWVDASASWASPSVSIVDLTLTASGSVTAGTFYCINTYFSGTAGNMYITYGSQVAGGLHGSSYAITSIDGGAWTRYATNIAGAWAYQVGGVWYPVNRMSAWAYTTTTAVGTAQYGSRYAAADYTARASFVCFLTSALGAGGEVTGVVYTGNAVLASTASTDTDVLPVTGPICLPLTASPIVQRGTTYDVMVYRSAGSGTVNVYKTASTTADHVSLMAYGSNVYGVSCTGTCETATNRTADTTKRYAVWLVLDAPYAGSGGFVVTQ